MLTFLLLFRKDLKTKERSCFIYCGPMIHHFKTEKLSESPKERVRQKYFQRLWKFSVKKHTQKKQKGH